MELIKRNGEKQLFDKNKIAVAIERAMSETLEGVDTSLSEAIATEIEAEVLKMNRTVNIEDIQDLVEDKLMLSPRKDVAKVYIVFRNKRNKVRFQKSLENKKGLLGEEFLANYKHIPNPMNQLGSFVYYRTYSRYLHEEGRREYWWETVRRAVEYNCSLAPNTSIEEAENLFDNIFNLKQFLAGRTFWVGGTAVTKNYPLSNFNCAFETIKELHDFKDLFYLLMVGCGVGVRILKSDVEKLPPLRYNYQLIQEAYVPVPKELRLDYTSLKFEDNTTAKISVGDSKEGWCQALDSFLHLVSNSEYRLINRIIINYDNVRARGERLKTFGGTAGWHEPLKNMFYKINAILQAKKSADTSNPKFFLKPLDCLDLANIIGENVVVGGVRRTAEIALVDADDTECINAKSKLYKMQDGEWTVDKELLHRSMSNNSIYFKTKPAREKLHWMFQQMKFSGEPGWVNEAAGKKRNPDMEGVNPCGEVLLSSASTCNLTTVNVMAFVEQKKAEAGEYSYCLNEAALLKAQRLSAKAAYRMTCVELELPAWDANLKKNRLLGCSLTGWQDLVNATAMKPEAQIALLTNLRSAAHEAADSYADELKMPHSLLITTVKPEGTLSQLPGVSSGIHYSHSPYYIRRVRINSNDPLVKVCEALNYPVFPEVGQDKAACTTKVVEFPVYAPAGRTKNDVSALEQLKNYLMFMQYYVDHNCSITVHVRADEWEAVEAFVWSHWEEIVAVTFLSYNDSFYQLLPYEAITKVEWEKRVAAMKPFIPSLISKYEKLETDYDVGQDGCEAGVCPVR